MKKLMTVLFFLMAFGLTNTLSAKELTLKEAMEATCRVIGKGHKTMDGRQTYTSGSGTVIQENKYTYSILTNAHVVRKAGGKVLVNFYRDGLETRSIIGKIVWRSFNGDGIDIAVIEVRKSDFKYFNPRVIPLASVDIMIERGTEIYGAGCPRGAWLQAWRSRILEIDNGRIVFSMMPESGQSGSAVMATVEIDGEKYTRIVGLLTWRIERPSQDIRLGSGLSLQQMYHILRHDNKAVQ